MTSIFAPLTKNVGIDLGTCTTQVYVEGRGIVLSEPSLVVMDERNKKVLAFGKAAEEMIAKAPETIKSHKPLSNGVIADYDVTRAMLGYVLSKCVRTVQRLRIMIGIPSGASIVEKRAVLEAVYQAGAKEAYLIETAAAAAIGAGLPVFDPVGNMVIDIGGGTTNIATLSLGGIAVARSVHLGSLDLNGTIREYLRDSYHIVTSEQTIEDIKISIGTAVLPLEDTTYRFTGRSLDDGLHKEISVRASDIYRVMGKPVYQILDLVKQVLQETPPELSADIMNHGIVLTGGGALLDGLDILFNQELGVPVFVAAQPLYAVATGAGKALAERERLAAIIEGAQHIYRRRF
jgi:rod shape-determining protein MreB